MTCQVNNLTCFAEKQQCYHVEGKYHYLGKFGSSFKSTFSEKFCSVFQEYYYIRKPHLEIFFLTIILALLIMKKTGLYLKQIILHNSLAQVCLVLPIYHYTWDICIVFSPSINYIALFVIQVFVNIENFQLSQGWCFVSQKSCFFPHQVHPQGKVQQLLFVL